MGQVIQFPTSRRDFTVAAHNSVKTPQQLTMTDYRALGDIQYTLIASGMSKDTMMQVVSDPDTGIANAAILSADITDHNMHAILGHAFSLQVTRFDMADGTPLYEVNSVLTGKGRTIFDALNPLVRYMNTNAREPRQKVRVLGLPATH